MKYCHTKQFKFTKLVYEKVGPRIHFGKCPTPALFGVLGLFFHSFFIFFFTLLYSLNYFLHFTVQLHMLTVLFLFLILTHTCVVLINILLLQNIVSGALSYWYGKSLKKCKCTSLINFLLIF